MKFGVVVFPGSNCDEDAVYALSNVLKQRVVKLWHKDTNLQNVDFIILPGGFSFGDHLGSGRLLGNRLRFALRDQLQQFVTDGKPIIGICNGFQALVKTGLLPGPSEASLEPDLIQRASLTLNKCENHGGNSRKQTLLSYHNHFLSSICTMLSNI